MIKDNIVFCDGPNCLGHSRQFVNNFQVQEWLEDRDEDYEEYGQFGFGVKRVSEVYHRVAGKLYCGRCVELLIEKTRPAALQEASR